MPAIVELYDDKLWPMRVPADRTARLALDGQVVELYLSEASRAELAELLRPWLALGHRPGAQHEENPRATGRKYGPQAPRGSVERRLWRRDLRAWSDSLGLRNPKAPEYPAWKNPIGKHSYPVDLERAFTHHQAGEDDLAKPLIEQFRVVA
jgi:hypothetical protein